MIAYDDFKKYYTGNLPLIELLLNTDSILFERLKDVIKVLHIIGYRFETKSTIKEEHELIFETGFSYFHESFELIKIYYHDYFNSDPILFKQYEQIIYYLLYINDFVEALHEKNACTEKREKTLSDLEKELETVLQERKYFTDDDLDKYNAIIQTCIPRKTEIITTDIVFSLIADELEG